MRTGQPPIAAAASEDWQLGGRRLELSGPVQVMGILNVTPDSFYDGGCHLSVDAAVARALQMEDEGAAVIDVGGESTRPPMYGGGDPVALDEELQRVLPVVAALREATAVPISIDTTKAEVAHHCLQAGADIINDTSALQDDDGMVTVAADSGAPVILMHRRGIPSTMQCNTEYDNLFAEVVGFLEGRIDFAVAGGVDRGRIAVDPGIGFGKSVAGNLQLIGRLDELEALGCPVLVGASRKSFIWKTLGLTIEESLEGSLAAALISALAGARILRVHDVASTLRAVRMMEAIKRTALFADDDSSRPS